MKFYTKIFSLALVLAGTNAYSLNCPTITVENIKSHTNNPIMTVDGTPWKVRLITQYNTQGYTITSITPPQSAEPNACTMEGKPSLCCLYTVKALDRSGKMHSDNKSAIFTTK